MRKKKRIIFVFKRSVLYSVTIGLMIMLAISSKATLPAAFEALKLCAVNVIPALFPFFVLSQILIKSGFATLCGKVFAPFMRKIFNVSGEASVAFLIGIISGYPMGAKAVCELYNSGSIEKDEAERLLPYCNNSGPLFIIGAVGTGMAGSPEIGIFLYVIHIITAFVTGIVLGFFSKNKLKTENFERRNVNRNKSIGLIFSESVKDAVSSILFVCGFVVLFAVLTALIPIDVTTVFGGLVSGIMEVTNGIKNIVGICDFETALPVISGILGFGGICVALQVAGIVKPSGLNMKHYIFGKMHHGIISFVVCKLMMKRFSVISTFNVSGAVNFQTGNFGATITSVFIICAFYFFVLALRKNFKKD